MSSLKYPSSKGFNITLLLLCCAGSSASMGGEDQYYWKDAQGKAVYSDQPPPNGVKYQVLDTTPTLRQTAPDDAASNKSEAGISEGNAPAAADAAQDSEKNPSLCESAKMNLIALNSTRALTVRNDKGDAKEMSPEDREIAKQAAQEQIDKNCE